MSSTTGIRTIPIATWMVSNGVIRRMEKPSIGQEDEQHGRRHRGQPGVGLDPLLALCARSRPARLLVVLRWGWCSVRLRSGANVPGGVPPTVAVSEDRVRCFGGADSHSRPRRCDVGVPSATGGRGASSTWRGRGAPGLGQQRPTGGVGWGVGPRSTRRSRLRFLSVVCGSLQRGPGRFADTRDRNPAIGPAHVRPSIVSDQHVPPTPADTRPPPRTSQTEFAWPSEHGTGCRGDSQMKPKTPQWSNTSEA